MEKFHNKYYRILEDYKDLRDLITYNFNLFLDNTQGNIRTKISTSWITKLVEGEKNLKHRHSQCFYSGVLYFDEEYEEGAAELELQNPIPAHHETIIPHHYPRAQEDKNNKTVDNIYIKPKTGLFLFFPSLCVHGTNDHVGKPRRSLAFNFVFDEAVYNFDSTYNPAW